MKLLKDVLLKLSRGGTTDRVIYIDNLPDYLLYSLQHPKVVKLMRANDPSSQYWTVDMDKPKEMRLVDELYVSPVGDNGIVFDMENNNAKDRWKSVDAYIKGNFPKGSLPPAPVPYSVDPSDPRSATLPLSAIPRIVLPVLSPSGNTDADNTVVRDAVISVDVEAIKQQAIKEYEANKKIEAKERMAKARASKATK